MTEISEMEASLMMKVAMVFFMEAFNLSETLRVIAQRKTEKILSGTVHDKVLESRFLLIFPHHFD